jgi:oligopeptide transport system ATP-binding protein
MRKDIQLIFQDPFSSLDPRMTVGQILMEPFSIHKIGSSTERIDLVRELLTSVGLDPSQLNRYPHEFSGGQRQRISIARSIALKPKLVIADEPVSALDVSVQAQVLNLLSDLREQLGLTYLFISHDLAVIEHFCDRVAVMYLGKIVEIADRDSLFRSHLHPYTDALMKSIPKLGAGKTKKFVTLQGEVPSPINPPSGCAFHPRCPRRLDKCSQISPALLPSAANSKQSVACWNPIIPNHSLEKI